MIVRHCAVACARKRISSVCMHDCLCVSEMRDVYAGSKGVSPATLQFVPCSYFTATSREGREPKILSKEAATWAFVALTISWYSLFGIGKDKGKRLENIVSRYTYSFFLFFSFSSIWLEIRFGGATTSFRCCRL